MAGRARLDTELARRGLAESRTVARELIQAGRVTVDGAPALKAATMVAPAQALVVVDRGDRWASRAGHKLAGALDHLAVDPAGRHCLDAGASTGGFTDVLLDRGATRVVAVDVGYGQLRWRLRSDPRVVVMDRTNVRHLTAGDVPPPVPTLVVADLSFISLRIVLPALRGVADPGADFVVMVKPQFEVGPHHVGRGGVVTSSQAWHAALDGVLDRAADLGLRLQGTTVSPLPGPSGNIEFFLHLSQRDATVGRPDAVAQVVAEGLELAHRHGKD